MTDLITRLESTDGPDRELDAMIQHRITSGVGCGAAQDAPRYTASIDAALTLVPEGWSYTVAWLHRNGRATVAMFHAKLNDQRAESHTPAIALCIAALKAKEADNGKSC